MKKHIVLSSFLFLVFLGVSASRSSAQEITGGYGPIPIKSRMVNNIAYFAVNTKNKRSAKKVTLAKVLEAESQVVAGMNYKICMRVRDRRGRVSTVTAIVYRDLRGRQSLTSWELGSCETN